MTVDATLQFDYEQTMETVRTLTDVWFKLLGLVPTVSALGVVVASGRSVGDAIGIGLVGTTATLGVLLYELRNSQLYSAAMHRAAVLERRLALHCSNPESSKMQGGLVSERPHTLRLAGVLVKHDRGLALVYAAAIRGWTYVLASVALPLLDGTVDASAR